MFEWFSSFIDDLTWKKVFIWVSLFLVMFAVSLVEVIFILVKLPARYFTKQYRVYRQDGGVSFWGVLLAIGKNLLGIVHIVAGILLSLPGIPGQGILTILLGVMLMDIPGVRWLERKIVHRPKVYGAINRIRARFGKPPLVLDPEPAAQEKHETPPPAIASPGGERR